jgi:predicted GNAT superfamily acetyltransferase
MDLNPSLKTDLNSDLNTGLTGDLNTEQLTIRKIVDLEGCRHFQMLDLLVWGSDPADLVPIHMSMTMAKNGGLLLGVYAPDGPVETGGMVGGALGWLGVGVDPAAPEAGPRFKFCSHIAGVLPAWQGRHVGLRLKLAQRRHVLQQGLTDWITWTYDPLYRPNAVFNIHRLGATCTTYLRDLYGELQDQLNAGTPSDRCQVDWRLNSPHVLHDIEPHRQERPWDRAALEVLPAQTNAAGFLVPGISDAALDGRPLAVPIPDDIRAIRQADGALSLAWRLYMRAVLEEAFAARYTMVDCIHLPGRGWHYILVREYL